VIRVFLVDDHEIVRRGVAELLDAHDDIDVVGEAETVRQASGRIGATLPDVALLDARLPDGSGIALCRDIGVRHPAVNCLIFTAYGDEDAVMAARLAGACGYVLKTAHGSDLVAAVRRASDGRSLAMSPSAQLAPPPAALHHDDDPRFESLGYRERQVLALITRGLTNRQIAEELGLAEKTVKNYVSGLLSKLGLERRTQAAVFNIELRNHEL